MFEQAIHCFKWIGAVQCNILTDIYDLVYLHFAEVGGDVPAYFFHRDKIFEKKMMWYKVIAKNRSKNISAGV